MKQTKVRSKKGALIEPLSKSERHFALKSKLIIDTLNDYAERSFALFGTTYLEFTMGDIAKQINLSRSSRLMRFLYRMCDAKLLVMVTKDPIYGTAITDANVFFVLPMHYHNRPQTMPMFTQE